MTKIDINKPLQLADGTPVRYVGTSDIEGATIEVRILKNSTGRYEGQFRHFRADGTHIHGDVPDLQNVPQVTKIDWSGPLETVDGQKVTYEGRRADGSHIVRVSGLARYYEDDGRHCYGVQPSIRNVTKSVPVPSLDLTKPLQRRDGRPVDFISKLDNGNLLFRTIHGNLFTTYSDGRTLRTRGAESADDVINVKPKPVVELRFHNLYADGSTGATPHKSMTQALAASKFGRVRVGVLRQEFTDGKLTYAGIVRTDPQLRTAAHPKGAPNPWA